MKKLITLILIMFSVSASAQTTKPQVSARPSEKKEIAADNYLKKSIQQKQLSTPPQRIADTSFQATTKKSAVKKKRSCCTKKVSKA